MQKGKENKCITSCKLQFLNVWFNCILLHLFSVECIFSAINFCNCCVNDPKEELCQKRTCTHLINDVQLSGFSPDFGGFFGGENGKLSSFFPSPWLERNENVFIFWSNIYLFSWETICRYEFAFLPEVKLWGLRDLLFHVLEVVLAFLIKIFYEFSLKKKPSLLQKFRIFFTQIVTRKSFNLFSFLHTLTFWQASRLDDTEIHFWHRQKLNFRLDLS